MTRTAIHLPTGEMVTPEGFIAREGADYRQRGAWPRCPACGAGLFVHGVHSPNVTSRFHHAKGSVCPLSASPDPRFAHLVPEAWDPAAGERLKRRFCEEDQIKQAYMVCHRLCGGRLASDEFVALCRRAARLGMFRYRGLPLWVVPWLLVTLEDFHEERPEGEEGAQAAGVLRNRRTYSFRFVLRKPIRSAIDVLWIDPESCYLEKVFVNSGRPVKGGCYKLGNQTIEEARSKTGWIGKPLLARLQECCRCLGVHG